MSEVRRALIVVDVQNQYFDGPLSIEYPPRTEALSHAARAVETAAAQGIPVVMVQHTAPADAPAFAEGSPAWQVHPDIARLATDEWIWVSKQYSSVFADTGLADLLRDKEIDTVTLVGFMTNNCDLASAVDTEVLGFTAEVLSDATGAINLVNEAGAASAEQVHTTVMALLHSNWAAVATTDQWVEAVENGSPLPTSNLVASALGGVEAAQP